MQVVASILKLGFLVTFLGHPVLALEQRWGKEDGGIGSWQKVISGFTSGAAIIIGLSQLKCPKPNKAERLRDASRKVHAGLRHSKVPVHLRHNHQCESLSLWFLSFNSILEVSYKGRSPP